MSMNFMINRFVDLKYLYGLAWNIYGTKSQLIICIQIKFCKSNSKRNGIYRNYANCGNAFAIRLYIMILCHDLMTHNPKELLIKATKRIVDEILDRISLSTSWENELFDCYHLYISALFSYECKWFSFSKTRTFLS